MKRFLSALTASVLMLLLLPVSALARELLIPAGDLIGLQLRDDTVTIAAFDEILGAQAQRAGLQIGDRLLAINGRAVRNAEDVKTLLQQSSPDAVTLTVSRGSKRREIRMPPLADAHNPRLGVYLRQGVSGIGTVTWYDPATRRFGTLGHGVSGPNGILAPMREGSIYPAVITAVEPGTSGHPGYLKGSADSTQCMGVLLKNTPQGVFGKASLDFRGEPLPVAQFAEIHTGAAQIRSTVSGNSPREYSVEILKIYPETRQDCRNFLLRVTDPTLLSLTGGIVQGMSGSPVIQDGRIVGAVTHVMVSDPTTGYGIFIGNMLDAAA